MSLLMRDMGNDSGVPSPFGHPIEALFWNSPSLESTVVRADQNVSAEALWHGGNNGMRGKKS